MHSSKVPLRACAGGKTIIAAVDRFGQAVEATGRVVRAVGYSSDRPAGDMGYRKIALTVNRKGLLVQSRDGYYPVAKRGTS